MPTHTNTMPAAMSSVILRSPNDLVRTLPATVNALLCLMLRRFQKRGRGADYIKRSSSSPFMGKYPAKPGDGAGSPPDANIFPIYGEVPGPAGGWGWESSQIG